MENMKNLQLLCVVILYDCSPEDSKTFQCLTRCLNESNNEGVRILLWNNGPVCQKTLSLGDNVDYYESLDNIALSKIYNTAINDYDADKYLFLDQDSSFTPDFLSDVVSTNAELLLPVIVSCSEALYPIDTLSKSTLNKGQETSNHGHSLYSIGSGLCLSKALIDLFHLQYESVFDERFVLYGVDTTFFKRIKCLPNFSVKILGELNHSLSRIEEKDSIPLFRKVERGYDIGLQLRYYYSRNLLVVFCLKLLNAVVSFEYKVIAALLRGAILGKHPRAKLSLINKKSK